jgi:hypothetical protein
MKLSRAGWANALLAVAVAALAAWIHFKPAKDAGAEHALSALKSADISSIRIERPGEPLIALERREDAWFVTAPFAARGNDARARQLAELAEAKTAHRYPATDLGRFELVEPQARVTLGGQVFSFGMVSPVTRDQYILAGDAVYAVSPRYGAVLPASAADVASQRLFGPAEAPVRFELPTFSVAQRDGAWQQTPAAADPSQDDLLRWVDEWRHATAARVELHTGATPADTIRVELKDGRQIVIAVLSRAPEVVLLRSDEKLKYTLRGAGARRMLAPPGSPAPPVEKK